MCGFAGVVSPLNSNRKAIELMTSSLAHRGPDDFGYWYDPTHGVALGHRRLSIVDLSASGHQPMVSSDGRYTIVFNGEIYNHTQLRQRLRRLNPSLHFSGLSDTEVLLNYIILFGLEQALSDVNGMFSFAFYDKTNSLIYLALDRFGEKPLYFFAGSSLLLFASELKAIVSSHLTDTSIDSHALSLYGSYGCIPAPFTIYNNIRKLRPGTYITINTKHPDRYREVTYWDATKVSIRCLQNSNQYSNSDYCQVLHDRLLESIRLRATAEVPLGVFLSSGLDSSLIAALTQSISSVPINTFTIGFDHHAYNESTAASKIAQSIGTNHTEYIFTTADYISIIPNLPSIWDEPFADSSQLPTYLVSSLASQSVKVALSGDGADEFFGGYNRYNRAYKIFLASQHLPGSLRSVFSSILSRLPAQKLESIVGFLSQNPSQLSLADKLSKLSRIFASSNIYSYYHSLLTGLAFPSPSSIFNTNDCQYDYIQHSSPTLHGRNLLMMLDTILYLPSDILTKLDRASMACGLECRSPYLDHEIFQLAWQMPDSLRNSKTPKMPLRQLLNQYIDPSLLNHPKQGFGIPLEYLLLGPLRPWVEDTLSSTRMKNSPYLNYDKAISCWNKFKTGKSRNHHQIWTILMFQSWCDSWCF